MNERIKELADQCWEEDGIGPDYFNPEKFANLILFECVKLSVFKGDKATAQAIKEHFEVKL